MKTKVEPIATKTVIVDGKPYQCKVLPYIPPTPFEEYELSWHKKSSIAASVGINPWPMIDEKLDND
jgi:hypothetical protein